MRAVHRVQSLGLSNCRFYQGNMDYFKGRFDIGVSLHACGVATDLVIQAQYIYWYSKLWTPVICFDQVYTK